MLASPLEPRVADGPGLGGVRVRRHVAENLYENSHAATRPDRELCAFSPCAPFAVQTALFTGHPPAIAAFAEVESR